MLKTRAEGSGLPCPSAILNSSCRRRWTRVISPPPVTDNGLDVQLQKLKDCDKVFKEKRSGLDTGRGRH
jgi:hypothetical protein